MVCGGYEGQLMVHTHEFPQRCKKRKSKEMDKKQKEKRKQVMNGGNLTIRIPPRDLVSRQSFSEKLESQVSFCHTQVSQEDEEDLTPEDAAATDS